MSISIVKIILRCIVLFNCYNIITLSIKEFRSFKNYDKKKKIKSLATMIFSFILLPLIIIVGVSFFFSRPNTKTQTDIMKTYDYVAEDYAAPHKIDDAFFDRMDVLYWGKIPESQKEMFKRDWKIVFDSSRPSFMTEIVPIETNPNNSSENTITGMSCSRLRMIYLNYLYAEDLEQTYIHEYGHSLAYELGSIDKSKEWQDIYNKYKDIVSNDVWEYYLGNESEFFAYYYSEYFINGEELQENLPEIYEYMDKVNHMEINDNTIPKVYNGIKTFANYFISYLF